MLAHLEERTVVDGKLAVHTSQKTACRAHFFNHKEAQLAYHLHIIGRYHLLNGAVAQRARD